MLSNHKIFICFAAEDRYTIAEPIVYHLKNYGMDVWYDRQSLLLGDNRIEKNLIQGAGECTYAIVIISNNTADSVCTMEELNIIQKRSNKNDIVVFPILYEIDPCIIPDELGWIKQLIFKEVNRSSGTRDICNHITCKITSDILSAFEYTGIQEVLDKPNNAMPSIVLKLLRCYCSIDTNNLNARVTMLYSAYLTIVELYNISDRPLCKLSSKIFERLFSETSLNISIDYRELWLLENTICMLINDYINYCNESSI